MIISPDITITKSVNEVLIEIDGKIEALGQRVTGKISELRSDIKALDEKFTGQIQELRSEMRTGFDALEARLTSQMDMRFNMLSSYIQWSMSFIAIIVAAAPVLNTISAALTRYLSRRPEVRGESAGQP